MSASVAGMGLVFHPLCLDPFPFLYSSHLSLLFLSSLGIDARSIPVVSTLADYLSFPCGEYELKTHHFLFTSTFPCFPFFPFLLTSQRLYFVLAESASFYCDALFAFLTRSSLLCDL